MPTKSKSPIITEAGIPAPRRNREPMHPGTHLRSILAETEGMTQEKLARELRVSFQTVNLIINGKRAVTADVALRLAKRFATSPLLWLNMQNAVDLWKAEQDQAAHA